MESVRSGRGMGETWEIERRTWKDKVWGVECEGGNGKERDAE